MKCLFLGLCITAKDVGEPRQFGGRKRSFSGESFWARGYVVSTIGLEMEMVKKYIAHQEKIDRENEESRF